jgi:hypothetical protein
MIFPEMPMTLLSLVFTRAILSGRRHGNVFRDLSYDHCAHYRDLGVGLLWRTLQAVSTGNLSAHKRQDRRSSVGHQACANVTRHTLPLSVSRSFLPLLPFQRKFPRLHALCPATFRSDLASQLTTVWPVNLKSYV